MFPKAHGSKGYREEGNTVMWCLFPYGWILFLTPRWHFNFPFFVLKMKLNSETSIYRNETPNEAKVKSFYFCISNPGKNVSMDGRPLIWPFHKVKHLPPNCPTSTNTFLRLQPTRRCLISRECRSLAIMPRGWVAPCPSDAAAGKTQLDCFSFLAFLPFLVRKVLANLSSVTPLLPLHTNMLYLIFLFCFIISHNLSSFISFACTWRIFCRMQCVLQNTLDKFGHRDHKNSWGALLTEDITKQDREPREAQGALGQP